MKIVLLFLTLFSVHQAKGAPLLEGGVPTAISSLPVVGTQFSAKEAKIDVDMRHGPDGHLFLDPYFKPFLEQLKELSLLDAGCGTAPWAIYAAKKGARVYGIDIQQSVIDEGLKAVREAKTGDKVTLQVGDVADLPFAPHEFDAAISINVGCNLPSTTAIPGDENGREVGLGPHFQEMARVLRMGGGAVITAPASFEVVFTDGSRSKDIVLKQIDEVLKKIGSSTNVGLISEQLNLLKGVYRATFFRQNGHLKLLTKQDKLRPGEEIWSKLPSLVVPNRYHTEEEYLKELSHAGLKVVKVHRPQFKNEAERLTYNAKAEPFQRMDEAYVSHHPFVIFVVEKSWTF